MNFEEFHKELFKLQDKVYIDFQAQMLPMVEKKRFIGIRSTELTKFAKHFFDDKSKAEFLKQLPHKYFEEDLMHVRIIGEMEDYGACLKAVKDFLPYVDNWSVCDSFIPKIFADYPDELIEEIQKWISSGSTYTVRFAISMLMKFYLDDNFDKKYLEMVAKLPANDYYIEMMAAWFFMEALIKHYKVAVAFLQNNLLAKKIQTKTIKKSVESRRLSDEQKEYLKTLRGRGF